MGKIIQGPADRYGVTKDFYVADVGYQIPTAPKTRTKTDWDRNGKHVVVPDYTLERLEAAEAEYVKLSTNVEKLYNNVFTLGILTEGSRIASLQSRLVISDDSTYNADSSLFVFNLQTGLVYNIPFTRMGEVVDRNILKGKYSEHVSNNGLPVDDALLFVSEIKETSGNIFANKGHEMTDEYFSAMLALFRLRTAGVVFGDLTQWVPYIVSGVTFSSIKFAFNRRMWTSSPVPLGQIEQFKDLPVEWARKLIVA